jgi:diguanylate cyclase (GGDEF)-like protein/PAS domain S-box-containing protein
MTHDGAEAASQLAAIVGGSDASIIQTDLDGIIRSANQSVRVLFGYDPAELIGQSIDILIPADRREQLAAVMATILAGGSHQALMTTRKRKNGSTFDASVRLSPVRDAQGALLGVSGITRDVTAELRDRSLLLASERRWHTRFDQSAMPQAILGLDGIIVSANDALCRLLHRDRQQLVGRSSQEFRHVDDPGGEAQIVDVSVGRRDAETWERVLSLGDGTAINVLVQACLLRDPDGVPYGMECFMQDVSSLHQARRALTRRETLFETLGRQASDFALLVDRAGRLRYVSQSMTTAFGYDARAITSRNTRDFIHPDDRAHAIDVFAKVVSIPGDSEGLLFRALDGERRWRWVEAVLTNYLDAPDIDGVVCNGRDVTMRVHAEQLLRDSEARYRAIAETAQEGIWTVGLDGRTVYANHKLAEILGLTLESIYASYPPDLFSPDDDRAFLLDKLASRAERGPEHYELTYPHPDGHPRVLRLSVSPLLDDTGATGSLAMITDITDERRAEEELRQRALYDELTGLANRTLLSDRLDGAAARSLQAMGSPVAVLFADLDQFRLINDSWGHDAGDRLLVAVGERLSSAVRASDTVARFGGDEFVIIREGAGEAEAEAFAVQLLQVLSRPFDVAGKRAYVTASVGIAVSPPSTGERLLGFAEAAMYDAKSRGRGRTKLFHPSLSDHANSRFSLSNDLREAIAVDGLDLFYQPQVDLTTGRVLGVEALARWNHPTRGPVPPMEFVALAEAVGLAAALDRWALTRACRDLVRLRACTDDSLRVAVNLSATNFADAGLEEMVLSTLQSFGLQGRDLELEITESAIMANPEYARALLVRFRASGMSIALDDFGTGYSSLGYLSRLPATTVKIDRSFVSTISEDPDSLAIVSSIIDLSRAMRLTTIAEGIETADQLAVLQRLGCTAGQGFLWSPALPLAAFGQRIIGLPYRRFGVDPLAPPSRIDAAS